MNIGNRITNLRKKKKITQQELADKLFVSDKTISSWELDRTEPSLELIIKISEVLGCSASYLIYGNVDKNDIETEIKIRISKEEYENLKLFMNENGNFIEENKQTDTYYQPTYRNFLKENSETITEWLRIGIRGNKKILNYKNWHNNMYCDEYEVEIDDEKNLDRILKILGLVEIATVDKQRYSYMYLEKYEVCLDYVKSLGYFIEIEVKKYNDSAMVEYDKLLMIAKKLNLNLDNIDKRGYPYHLIYKENE